MTRKPKPKKPRVSLPAVRASIKKRFSNSEAFATTSLPEIRKWLIKDKVMPASSVLVRFCRPAPRVGEPYAHAETHESGGLRPMAEMASHYRTGLRDRFGLKSTVWFRVYPALEGVPTEELLYSLPRDAAHGLLLPLLQKLSNEDADTITSAEDCLLRFEDELRLHGILPQ